MRDTTRRGDMSELQVAAALARAGRKLLRPLSAASRYDLLIDNEDGSFTRVQCKTGVLRAGRIEFRLYRVSGHGAASVPYGEDVDAYGVYCPQLRATYLVPASEVAGRTAVASLRVTRAENGQAQGVRLAERFLIADGS